MSSYSGLQALGGGARGSGGFTTRIGAYERPPEYDATADPHLAEFWRRREMEQRQAQKKAHGDGSRRQKRGGAQGGAGRSGAGSVAQSPSRRGRGRQGAARGEGLYGAVYETPVAESRSPSHAQGGGGTARGRRANEMETATLYHEQPRLCEQQLRAVRVSRNLRSPSRPATMQQSPGRQGRDQARGRLNTAPGGVSRRTQQGSGGRSRNTALDAMQRLWRKLEVSQEEQDFAYSRTVSSSLLAKAYTSRLRDVAWLRSTFVSVFTARQRAVGELQGVFDSGKGSRRRLFSDLQILHVSTMRLASLTNSVRVLCNKPVSLPGLQISSNPANNFLIYLLIENIFTRQNLALVMAALRFEGVTSLVECTNRVNVFFDNCKRYCAADAGEDPLAGQPDGESLGTSPGEAGAAEADALDSSPLTDDIISLYFILGITVGDDFTDNDLPERWVEFLLAGPPEGPSLQSASPLTPDDVYAMVNAELDLISDYRQAERKCGASSVKMSLVPVSPVDGSVEVYESRASPLTHGRERERHARGGKSAGDGYGGRRNTSPRRFRQVKGDDQLETFGLELGLRKSPSAEPCVHAHEEELQDRSGPEGAGTPDREPDIGTADEPEVEDERGQVQGDEQGGVLYIDAGEDFDEPVEGETLGDDDFNASLLSPGVRGLSLTGSGGAKSDRFDLQSTGASGGDGLEGDYGDLNV